MKPVLQEPPRVERLQTSKTLTALGKIDPTGGRYGAGLIPEVSLCTRGEALGHGRWIDALMIRQIVELCNANPKLLKSRFAHPDWCDDGTGKALGTIENATERGDQAIGDLHLYKSAHGAPDGDLAGYVMSLAAEDPVNFGLSIVFEHDWEAEQLFEAENTQEIELKDDSGQVRDTDVQFVSPDENNVNNLPHARIKKLWAADVVDDPAANEAGLFHRRDSIPAQGRKVLDYVFGRSTESPQVSAFGIAPERVKEFVSKYLADAGLSVKKEEPMPKPKFSLLTSLKSLLSKAEASETPKEDEDETKQNADNDEEKEPDEQDAGEPEDEKPEDKSAETPADETDEEDADPDEVKDKSSKCSAAKLSKFVERFGAANGSKWAIEGISYATALERHTDLLTASLADSNTRLEALGQSGTDPVKFSHAPKKSANGKEGTSTQPDQKLVEAVGEGLARVAACIKLPA